MNYEQRKGKEFFCRLLITDLGVFLAAVRYVPHLASLDLYAKSSIATL